MRPLLVFALCLARPLALLRTVPFLGASAMPPQALTAFAMSLVLLVYPVAEATAPPNLGLDWSVLPLVLKEVFLGFVLGFIVGLLFWAAQMLGFLVDNQRGATMAQSQDPLSGDEASPLSSLLFQSVAMLFFLSGAFASLVRMLVESYMVWPLFAALPRLERSGLVDFMLAQADLLLRVAVTLGGPVLALCFLTDFGLGLISRFAPQLNVFSLSMPIKSVVAVAVMVVYAGALLTSFQGGIAGMDALFARLREALR